MKQKLTILAIQILAWLVILALPMFAAFIITGNLNDAMVIFGAVAFLLKSYIVLYFTNFYAFVPYFLFKRRWVWFAVGNVVVFCLANTEIFFGVSSTLKWIQNYDLGDQARNAIMYAASGFSAFSILNLFAILAAVGVRYILRTNEMRQKLMEETARRHEAELTMLKHQLNPHFLFNTLNNISSMVAVSPEKAQDSIAQLADLLRYNLYESDAPQVPLAGEIEYMQNYISLMSLRYGQAGAVEVEMPQPRESVNIAPMLFISLIENAFKHGMSSARASFVRIKMTCENGMLGFIVENSLHPRQETDRAGSGIGLANIRRRLDLLYPGRYCYEVSEEDGVYKAEITINI